MILTAALAVSLTVAVAGYAAVRRAIEARVAASATTLVLPAPSPSSK